MQTSKKSGFTLIETGISVTVTVVAATLGIQALVAGMSSAANSAAKVDAISDVSAADAIIAELREATDIEVRASGKELDYSKPARDVNGLYVQPMQSDNIARRIRLHVSNNVAKIEAGPKSSPIILAQWDVTSDTRSDLSFGTEATSSGTVVTFNLVSSVKNASVRTVENQTMQSVLVRNSPNEVTQGKNNSRSNGNGNGNGNGLGVGIGLGLGGVGVNVNVGIGNGDDD